MVSSGRADANLMSGGTNERANQVPHNPLEQVVSEIKRAQENPSGHEERTES